jgi:putative endonuclease
LQPQREFSSAGLEHLPYKQRVGGSIPSTPTKGHLIVAFFINMFTVYILYSIKFDRFYKGQTSDLNRRLKEHNNQEEKSTANFVPWILVWHKLVSTRSEAVILEKKLKNITSKKRIRDFIKRNTN